MIPDASNRNGNFLSDLNGNFNSSCRPRTFDMPLFSEDDDNVFEILSEEIKENKKFENNVDNSLPPVSSVVVASNDNIFIAKNDEEVVLRNLKKNRQFPIERHKSFPGELGRKNATGKLIGKEQKISHTSSVNSLNSDAKRTTEGFSDGANNNFILPSQSNSIYFLPSGDYENKLKYLSSVSSSSQISHQIHKLPTSPEVKKKVFTDVLTTCLSTIYAILIVIMGISFYVVEFLKLENQNVHIIAEAFSLALLTLALVYLLYLIIDIFIYNSRKKLYIKLMEKIQLLNQTSSGNNFEENESLENNALWQKAKKIEKKIDHRYCFNLDRHSSNFYLKIGAAIFCFGHLIHSFLILTYRGIIMSSEEETSPECLNVLTFIIEILYPIYSIILLFYIFKYSNVIINKNRDFHRFGFMHCLASSLCFWLWTIFRETSEYIENSQYSKESEKNSILENIQPLLLINPKKIGIITPRRFTSLCQHDELNIIYQKYSPYLYPFSVEYSILVVGIIYIVWKNIGLCLPNNNRHLENEEEEEEEDTRECRKNRRLSEPESNITIHADCHASNKGLFSGFLVLVFVIVSLILFFITVYSETKGFPEIGLRITQSTRIVILIIMTISVICAYAQMIKLDFNIIAHNSLDIFLCLMCLPAFFLNAIFSIIPGIIFGNIIAVSVNLLEILQVVLQTTFIIDGMARSSNTKNLRKKKPGREFVTFLVICNVAMWIMQTFEVKSHGLDEYRQEFYSKKVWSVLGHMCLPLMMFYRFHCSVCIGDIWKYAYIPSGHLM